MIVHLHTIVHNEIERLPFAINYWKLCATHVFVYLMKSTNDGSKEYLEQYSDFITIQEIDDNDGFNDKRNQQIKNDVWKLSRGISDFVIITDFDEFVYSPTFFDELKYMKENGFTIVAPEIYNLVTYDDIVEEGIKEQLLHQQIKYGTYDMAFGKHCIFNPNEITEINYSPGAHFCHPTGKVKYYDRKNIYLFHAKYLGLNFFLKKNNTLCERLSTTNIMCGYGIHYRWNDEKKICDFKEIFNKRQLLPI